MRRSDGAATNRSIRAGRRMLYAGLLGTLAVDLNLLAKNAGYPTEYAHGAVCACGQPVWFADWGLATYALLAVSVGVFALGILRMLYARTEPGGAPPSVARPDGAGPPGA